MTIRTATRPDLDNLYSIWTELMDEHQTYHPIFGYHRLAEAELKRVLLQRLQEPYTRFFIVESSEGLAGLLVAMYQIGNNGMHFNRRGYIAETIVRPQFRRTGLGRLLFETAREWLTRQGADHLELQVAVANPGGQQFWAALGFTPATYHLMLPLSAPANPAATGQPY
ncbi:GNAT family N-acetyltransferase [Hymenobacter sp. HSC-4F20]|uniref:GNAT family N-acetyltransferase n=1 Tax=Hymenobacter sp. HSC-4F20 TaxID=2864135 RepID=UPI001C731E73|nr:GNAT family N-acetyltransferase [Hymenobacter sp. HSC-4F20]MBX0292952.1 GNAT family N-acetyltransferase [Hymenobacter sp. HSC-4F20]